MYGHRLAVILAAMTREHYPTLCGMACRANESMVLGAWDSVPDHVGQDHQLGTARPTMHRSHVYRTSPVARVIDIGPAAVQVRLWICLRRTPHVPLVPFRSLPRPAEILIASTAPPAVNVIAGCPNGRPLSPWAAL
jgi:hypothetical protein